MSKLVYGIGTLGIGKFKSSTNIYFRWYDIFSRCYCVKELEKYPSYQGCSVDSNWHNFQNFAEWFTNNYIEGFELDKDILVPGNKIYGPNTCCFVPKELNLTLTVKRKKESSLPIGVNIVRGRFVTSVNSKYKGTFNTAEEAFQVYKTEKEKEVKILADKYKSVITPDCYNSLYSYEVK